MGACARPLPLAAREIAPGHWTVDSESQAGVRYTVRWYGRNGICSCRGAAFSLPCKHLRRVRELAGVTPTRKDGTMAETAIQRVPVRELGADPRDALTHLSVSELLKLAPILVSSGLLPQEIKTPQQAAAVMLKGQELRIPPMQALAHIHVVKGKPGLSAELSMALIKRAYGRGIIRVVETTAQSCTVEWREPGWEGTQSYTWTMQDATVAGLAGEATYKRYPAAMLRAGCVRQVARMAFPECLGGMEASGEGAPAPAGGMRVLPNMDSDPGAPLELPERGTFAPEPIDGETLPASGRGEVLDAACAVCGAMGECVDDGEAYICRDQGACATRCLTEAGPAPSSESTEPAGDSVSAQQLKTIGAHLARTGKSEAAVVAEIGRLDRLSHSDASALIRDLSRLPNADAAEVAF